ncbi:hypothetical protein FF38_09400 [Lucilia cuprina]|uniref:BED-type domain-containing protein n=1 Tax=Lucilia cuprina TaxID=7375 RepID=A0A0L0CT54_LUCCU|nr:hypothetical protein FF38_09400 [Lucilia cuprina]
MLRYLQKEKASGDDGANQDDESGSSTSMEDWLKNPDINSWAEKRDSKVFCKICNVELKVSSGKSDLMAHFQSKKHQDAAKATYQTKKKLQK